MPGTGKEFLHDIANGAAVLLENILTSIAGLDKPWLQREVYGGITWAGIITSACFIGLVLLLHGIILGIVRWKNRSAAERAPEGKESWTRLILDALGKPLYFALWVYGVYFALIPLLLGLEASGQPHPLRLFFDKVFDAGIFVALLWFFFRLTGALEKRLQSWTAETGTVVDNIVLPLLVKAIRVALPVMAIILALPVLGLPPAYEGLVSKASTLLIIGMVAWVFVQGVLLGEKLIMSRYNIDQEDNLRARQVFTQVHVLKKTLLVVITIFTVASVLMTFEEVRRLGTSILASAGVIGIILGFAAQKTIANLFAGFQLAMTQPVRIDDVVIVEGEWGRIEEITLTYVVIRIWDLRRLVVPLSYFIEKPFQNWTRISADILGSVMIYADYTLPFDKVRDEVKRIVEGCADWDGKFWNLQVTDASERTVAVRVLATAGDASKAWNLRCEIREKLVAFIQQHYPQSLPRMRAELDHERERERGEGKSETPVGPLPAAP